jgi:protoporphyrinogen oxidase
MKLPNDTEKIAIVAGAGPGGLTVAYELKKRTDIKPIVFEKTDSIGGISQTASYKGNRIDLGGHRFYTKSQRVRDWWFSLLPVQSQENLNFVTESWSSINDANREIEYLLPNNLSSVDDSTTSIKEKKRFKRVIEPAPHPDMSDEVMLSRNRLSRIFHNNCFFPYPLSISPSVVSRLGFVNSISIFVSYLYAHVFPRSDEKYLDSFFINRFGKRLYETFFKDYTEKVWGVPCSQIQADWGAQRIKGLSLKKALWQALKDMFSKKSIGTQQERETSLINHFYYPKLGPGQMWEVAAKRITDAGGDILKKHNVSELYLENNKVSSALVTDSEGAQKKQACDYFFSTMPLKELVGIISPPPPAEVQEIASNLVYRDFMTVGLLLKKLHVRPKANNRLFSKVFNCFREKPLPLTTLPDNWIYIQDGVVRVGRVQIFNNWSPYLVADPENTVWLGLEYFVNIGDDLWNMKDEDMIELGISEMEKIGFIQRNDFLDGCVLRVPKAYPAYFGSYKQLSTVYDYFNTIPNLFLIGRNGLHRYNNQDHSMMTAMLAVDLIESNKSDKKIIFECNIDSDYQEENPRSSTAPRV